MLTLSRVRLDPADAYPGVAEVRAAVAAHDWPACLAVLDAVLPDARQFLLRDGGEHAALTKKSPGLEDFLRGVLAGDPADAAAAAMLAFFLIETGWSVRTRLMPEHVSREQFAEFHEWLRRAERVLVAAVARTPDEPALWVARILTARGLQLGLAESRRRYDHLRALDPQSYLGQEQLLQRLCPKWGGFVEDRGP